MTPLNQLFASLAAWLSQRAALGWWVVALSICASLGGLILMRWIVLRMPHDYFVRSEPIGWQVQHPIVRWCLIIGKNLIGVVLLVLGLTMLITPGPGIVMVLISLLLLDIPGKRELERRLILSPSVLGPINRLRAKANRPALELPAKD